MTHVTAVTRKHEEQNLEIAAVILANPLAYPEDSLPRIWASLVIEHHDQEQERRLDCADSKRPMLRAVPRI